MDEIVIYTDGGCHGNPGPGAWGLVIIANEEVRKFSGGEEYTTNNRMELTAAIKALEVVKNTPEFSGKKIIVNIDSQYVKSGITDWITKWKERNWKNSERKPVKNKDLWLVLDELNSELSVEWIWVKGHSGVEYNEICDQLCQEEIAKFESKD